MVTRRVSIPTCPSSIGCTCTRERIFKFQGLPRSSKVANNILHTFKHVPYYLMQTSNVQLFMTFSIIITATVCTFFFRRYVSQCNAVFVMASL